MAAVNPPSYLQNANHSAKSDRLTIASLLAPLNTALSVRGGIRASGDGLGLAVQPAGTPNNTVTVRSGTAFVPEAAGSGVYVCHNDASVTLTVANASTTQNRKDLIIAQVRDQEVSGGDNDWQLAVVTGTSVSGTATAPAVPQNALALAEISIPAGNTTTVAGANITDRRATAAALGGSTQVLSTALPTNPYLGMQVVETDTERVRVWNGSAWLTHTLTALPAPALLNPVAITNTITSATFGVLPTRHIINYTTTKALWANIHLNAWMQGNPSGDCRATVSLNSATVGPGTLGIMLTGSDNWGEVLFSGIDQYTQQSVVYPVQLNAGTTVIELRAMRNGTGTVQVNYPTMRVMPLRWV